MPRPGELLGNSGRLMNVQRHALDAILGQEWRGMLIEGMKKSVKLIGD